MPITGFKCLNEPHDDDSTPVADRLKFAPSFSIVFGDIDVSVVCSGVE